MKWSDAIGIGLVAVVATASNTPPYCFSSFLGYRSSPESSAFSAENRSAVRVAHPPAERLPKRDDDDPVLNFERLWAIFDRRYAFFELRGVDWDRVHERFRPRITDQTSDEELFQVFCEMLELLRDGHVTIESEFDEYSSGPDSRFDQVFDDEQAERLFQTTHDTLARAGFGETFKATGMLRYSFSDELAYIRIRYFSGPSQAALNHALDRVLDEIDHVKGVIIDILDNPGGEDVLAYTVAQRFADERRLGHYKITRRGPGRWAYGKPRRWFLQPEGKRTFSGPVVLLTNDASFSAADVFALAMAQIPQVTIVGEPTYGIFSDTLERDLPNGWHVTLSHQKYFSPRGICYEGRGVPVDVQVQNSLADLETGTDVVVARALALLAGKK